MRTYRDYNRVSRKILENNKTHKYKEICFNLLQKSLEINPDFFGTYNLLGIYYSDIEDYDNAEICFRKSIDLNENNISSHLNLFSLYYKQEKIDQSIEIGNKIINFKEFNFYDFYDQLGMLYFLNGDFENGWKYYKFTREKIDLSDLLNFDGEVIILGEQGLGDNILFCRFGKLLKNIGIKVSYACSSKLINLIKSSKIYHEVYDIELLKRDKNKKYIPLFSVPTLFNKNSSDFTIDQPYFFADNEKINYWKSKLNSNKLIVGINWQGKETYENEIMEGRSFPLNKFEKISKLDNIQLVSIQNGYGYEQLKECNFSDKILDFGNGLSLDDVAAIIMNCDVVITPCTMICHLSSSLGKETWTLIKRIPFWFWGLNTEENIMYPTTRLFRQNNNGDWSDVFERVEKELINKKKND